MMLGIEYDDERWEVELAARAEELGGNDGVGATKTIFVWMKEHAAMAQTTFGMCKGMLRTEEDDWIAV